MKEIPLTRGKVALVDDEDYEWLSQWKWNADSGDRVGSLWYARRVDRSSGKKRIVRMHRLILGITNPKVYVDHKNHNGLDNQKENLRTATCAQNHHNTRRWSNGSSKYKGVCLRRASGKWEASITQNKKHHHLGTFLSEEEAALAYDVAACDLFGIYARLNFGEFI